MTPETRIPPLMMQIGSTEWSDLIIGGAAEFDLDLDAGHARQFAIHATELIRWNRKINITAITDPLEIAVKHFLDSLSIARFIPPEASLLDIGSGGGFPGLPLKILLPSLSVTLIDASRKRVNFLKHVIRALKLGNIEACHIRAEAFSQEPRNQKRYDIIASRALSALDSFCSLALPLLAPEGTVIAMKGDVSEDELNALQGRGRPDPAKDKFPGPGIQLPVSVHKLRLPFIHSNRSIVLITAP